MVSSRLVRKHGLLLAGMIACALACAEAVPDDRAKGAAPPSAPEARLEALGAFEAAVRARTDFSTQPDGLGRFGADPYRIRSLPDGTHAGLLAGSSALVRLDARGAELERHAAPDWTSGLAVTASGDVFVSGRLSSSVQRHRLQAGRLHRSLSVEIAGAHGIRDLAVHDGILYALDELGERVITLRPDEVAARVQRQTPVGRGCFRLLRVGRHLLVNCLVDHTLSAYGLDAEGVPDTSSAVTIEHDGPIWSFAAEELGSELLVALGGVEDRPLDRSGGSFGYIDSFVFLYVLTGDPPAAERVHVLNVSSLGVVVPKALALGRADDGSLVLDVTGYGATRALELRWPGALASEPAISGRELPPGSADLERLSSGERMIANPLLDAWLVERDGAISVVAVEDGDAARSELSRLGEALLFTTLIAPANASDGPLSRFTCETCHFEGGIDGRTHHTGRANVFATTRPLFGLFNNRPHFSRALDTSLTKLVNSEFRVAGAGSNSDPWFSLELGRLPWLQALGIAGERLDPEHLRRSLMTYLMELSSRPNARSRGRRFFDSGERAGAELFQRRCERCHAARLATDEPASRIEASAWEDSILSPNAPITWARAERMQTGVVPYVHREGARVPSLRRLAEKRPYFTNGSAPDLDAVLARARFDDARFLHAAAPDEPALHALDVEERRVLRAFLELL